MISPSEGLGVMSPLGLLETADDRLATPTISQANATGAESPINLAELNAEPESPGGVCTYAVQSMMFQQNQIVPSYGVCYVAQR